MIVFFCGQLAIELFLRAGRQGVGVRQEPVPGPAFHRDRLVVDLQDVTFRVLEIDPVKKESEDDLLVRFTQLPQVMAEVQVILLLQLFQVVFLLLR